MSSSLTQQAVEPVTIYSVADALGTNRHYHFSQQAAEPSLKISAAAFQQSSSQDFMYLDLARMRKKAPGVLAFSLQVQYF